MEARRIVNVEQHHRLMFFKLMLLFGILVEKIRSNMLFHLGMLCELVFVDYCTKINNSNPIHRH